MARSSYSPASSVNERDETHLLSAASSISLPTLDCFTAKVDTSSKGRSSHASMARLSSMSTACPDSPTHECLSQDEFSSTDAGDDDICPIFVELTSSDSEHGDDLDAHEYAYSIGMLLRFRSAARGGDNKPPVQYATRNISDLTPSAGTKTKHSVKSRAAEASWRQPQHKLPASAADSWISQQRKCAPDEDAKVLRSLRSILNKLTLEKFESLFAQLTTCGVQLPHHISMLMREIFEKATIQHHFIPMYADLCVRLEKDETIIAVVMEAGELHNFRRLLINQCQIVFEQVLEPSTSESDKIEMDEEMCIRRKQRALGNMKLIGHLLVRGMLSSSLFLDCCEQLLRNRMECPDALEALVSLVMVAGPTFDNKAWRHFSRLEKIFSDMKRLTSDKPTPPRLRFLIRDVLDARSGAWPGAEFPTIVADITKPEAPTSGHENKESAVQQQKQSLKTDVSTKQEAAPHPWRKMEKECEKAHASKTCAITEPCSQGLDAKQMPPNECVREHDQMQRKEQSKSEIDFDVVAFRRTLASVFNDLASDKNIPAAVQRIRAQEVPLVYQADQFVDIITRIVEERRGAVRRCQLAFAAGLVAADASALDRKECLEAVKMFFQDVYNSLCSEVHRLPAIMRSEFMPTMLNVFGAPALNSAVPVMMQR